MRNSANALLLGMLFFFLLFAGGVEAAEGDIIFEDDAESGTITDKWNGTGHAYSSAQAHTGTYSIDPNGAYMYTLMSNMTNRYFEAWVYADDASDEGEVFIFGAGSYADADNLGSGYHTTTNAEFSFFENGNWRATSGINVATGWFPVAIYMNVTNSFIRFNNATVYNATDNDVSGTLRAFVNANAASNTQGWYIDDVKICEGTFCNTAAPPPASTPYAHIKLLDSYDNSTISGVTVFLGTESNVTDGSGVAYFYNHTTGLNYSTDGGSLYFSASGTAVENATTNAYTYGAFVSLSAYNIANASVATFNASSGSKVNTTTTGSLNLMLKPNTSNTIVVNGSGYLSKTSSITPTGEDLGSYNITGLYQSVVSINGTHYNGSKIYNFTINYTGVTNGTVTTTNGTASFTALFGNYTVIFDASGYALYNTTIVVNATTKAYQFVAYTTNSILFSFYDVDTDDLINGTNITVQIDGGLGEYTTSTGSLYIDLITPATYNMAYAALGYVDGFYIFTITDRTTQAINLTMLNLSNSDQVTLYVYDTLGNRLEGAVIKILRYSITNDTFSTVSILQTNIEGLVETSLTKDTQYYKFIIEYDDEVRYTSVPTYIYGTTLSFYINTAGETLVSTFDGSQINGQISFNEATGQASFTYSDADNIATQGCFYAYKASDLSVLNSTCVSSSTGVLYLPTSNTTTNWYLAGKVTKGGIEYLIDTYRKDYDATLPDTGGLGMFLGFIIFVVVIFIGIWSLEIAVVLGSALPLLLTFTGLIAIGYVISVPIFILGIIAAFIIGVKR